MQKQTIHINFNPSDMKDYVYAVAGDVVTADIWSIITTKAQIGSLMVCTKIAD